MIMDNFFLPGTPLYKRFLAIIILSSILASIAGHFIDFLPSIEMDRWGKYIATGLASLFVLSYCLTYKLVKRDYYWALPKKKITWFLYIIGTPVLTFYIFYTSFAYSFPRVCHIFNNSAGEIVVTVCDKHYGLRSGYTLEFKEYDYLWYKHLYGISKNLWNQIDVGDELLLEGSKSWFGFVVNTIAIKKRSH